MASQASSVPSTSAGKGKRKSLSMGEKLKVIELYEKGTKRGKLMTQFDLKKSTLHDILRAKDRIREVVKKIEGRKAQEVFRSRKLHHEDLDEAVYKWYVQQRAEGLPVRSLDIHNAAQRLANHLGIQDFKCSDSWLWRFRRRHGLGNRAITGKPPLYPRFQKVLLMAEHRSNIHKYCTDVGNTHILQCPSQVDHYEGGNLFDVSSSPGYDDQQIKPTLHVTIKEEPEDVKGKRCNSATGECMSSILIKEELIIKDEPVDDRIADSEKDLNFLDANRELSLSDERFEQDSSSEAGNTLKHPHKAGTVTMLEQWSEEEVCAVIRFLNAKHVPAVEIHSQLVEVYGNKVMSCQRVREWCLDFKTRHVNQMIMGKATDLR